MPQNLNEKVRSERLHKAFDLMSAKNFDAAEAELFAGINEAETKGDPVLMALFYSSLGVLYKVKKDFTKAWKYYEKAEKLLPQDPALKLISARLLIDIFGQYDTAIRRCQKAMEIARNDPPFWHQANTIMGLALLKKGEQARAVQSLIASMRDDFEGLLSANNIDLKLLEELIRKKAGLAECRIFLEKALKFSENTGEEKYISLMSRLLDAFPSDQDLSPKD